MTTIKASADEVICELNQRINMVVHRERLARQIALAESAHQSGTYGRVQLPPAIEVGAITLISGEDKAYDEVLAALKGRLARQDEALRLLGIEITEAQAEAVPA